MAREQNHFFAFNCLWKVKKWREVETFLNGKFIEKKNVRDANLWNKAAGYHNSSSFFKDYSFTSKEGWVKKRKRIKKEKLWCETKGMKNVFGKIIFILIKTWLNRCACCFSLFSHCALLQVNLIKHIIKVYSQSTYWKARRRRY